MADRVTDEAAADGADLTLFASLDRRFRHLYDSRFLNRPWLADVVTRIRVMAAATGAASEQSKQHDPRNRLNPHGGISLLLPGRPTLTSVNSALPRLNRS
jgi:hypothetical protein